MASVTPASTDEIYEKYLKKAIVEINELGDEIARAARLGDLVGEIVDLDDRLLEVLLVDLIRRRHRPRTFLLYRTRSLAWAIHFSDWR